MVPPERWELFGREGVLTCGHPVTEPPDQELIERCLGGRTEAFGLLVDRYQHRLYGTLVHVVGSAEQARDVAQDAFLHAFEKLATFRGQSAFYSWLFRIALNAAVSARRKTSRIQYSIDAAREATGEEPVDGHAGAAPWQALHVADRQRIVQQALAELPEEYRTALVLKEMDELKYEEIAEILDIPIGTVRSRIHRGRQELRAKLQTVLQAEE
jgi:RNA polymerase sigma-70 factor (ECF subfamily)